jgi:ABC-2 type transport system permease protein
MPALWVLVRKELRSFFLSPYAYLLCAMYALIVGLFFWTGLGRLLILGVEAHAGGQALPVNLNQQLLRPLLLNVGLAALFFAPLISMRLIADERRHGTIELLATSPVCNSEIILAKWLASFVLYTAMLLFTALNIGFLFHYGNPDWKPLAIGYAGLLLQAAALLAIGIFISSLSKSPILAGALTCGLFLFLWIVGSVGAYEPSSWAHVLAYLSFMTHLQPFARGVVMLQDVVFYLSLTLLGLFLAARSMELSRWSS